MFRDWFKLFSVLSVVAVRTYISITNSTNGVENIIHE